MSQAIDKDKFIAELELNGLSEVDVMGNRGVEKQSPEDVAIRIAEHLNRSVLPESSDDRPASEADLKNATEALKKLTDSLKAVKDGGQRMKLYSVLEKQLPEELRTNKTLKHALLEGVIFSQNEQYGRTDINPQVAPAYLIEYTRLKADLSSPKTPDEKEYVEKLRNTKAEIILPSVRHLEFDPKLADGSHAALEANKRNRLIAGSIAEYAYNNKKRIDDILPARESLQMDALRSVAAVSLLDKSLEHYTQKDNIITADAKSREYDEKVIHDVLSSNDAQNHDKLAVVYKHGSRFDLDTHYLKELSSSRRDASFEEYKSRDKFLVQSGEKLFAETQMDGDFYRAAINFHCPNQNFMVRCFTAIKQNKNISKPEKMVHGFVKDIAHATTSALHENHINAAYGRQPDESFDNSKAAILKTIDTALSYNALIKDDPSFKDYHFKQNVEGMRKPIENAIEKNPDAFVQMVKQHPVEDLIDNPILNVDSHLSTVVEKALKSDTPEAKARVVDAMKIKMDIGTADRGFELGRHSFEHTLTSDPSVAADLLHHAIKSDLYKNASTRNFGVQDCFTSGIQGNPQARQDYLALVAKTHVAEMAKAQQSGHKDRNQSVEKLYSTLPSEDRDFFKKSISDAAIEVNAPEVGLTAIEQMRTAKRRTMFMGGLRDNLGDMLGMTNKHERQLKNTIKMTI